MKNILLLILYFFPFILFAQPAIPNFGTVDKKEFEITVCDFDPEASAIKLFDITDVDYSVGEYVLRITTERRVRIKIINEQGFKHAKIDIPYFNPQKSTRIKDLSAVIYNMDSNGNISTKKLEKDDFFRQNVFTSYNVIHFTFPNLKKGSIIEYRYRKVEKNIAQIDPWIIQDDMPTTYAVNTIVMPQALKLEMRRFGLDSIPTITTAFKGKIQRTFFLHKVPSFKEESYMSSNVDNLMKLFFLVRLKEFSFITGKDPEKQWKFIGSMMFNSSTGLGKVVNMNIEGTEFIVDSARKLPGVREKLEFIYESVKRQIPEPYEQSLMPDGVSKAWKEKSGNSSDINLILLNLLRKTGVDAHPLLVSTRDNGMVAMDFPSIGQFNGIDVAAFDTNKVYVMDASLKNQPFDIPPFNIIERNALLAENDNTRWVYITDKRPLIRTHLIIDATMEKDGSIKGTANEILFHYARLAGLDSTSKEEQNESGYEKNHHVNVHPMGMENLHNKSGPLVRKLNFEYQPVVNDEFAFISPEFLLEKKKNPFLPSERQTDIDFVSTHDIQLELRLHFPNEYEVESIPSSVRLRSGDTTMVFSRLLESKPNQIYFRQTFEIKRPVFEKREYAGLKSFYAKMFSLLAEEIILRKRASPPG